MAIDLSRAKELFLAALEMPLHERAAYLESACGGDTALRQRIEAMLKSQEASGELLPRSPAQMLVNDDATQADASAALPPQSGPATLAEDAHAPAEGLPYLTPSTKPGSIGRLGHYEILEVLGKGGFGVVLKAFDERLHRVVAIKVLSPAYAAVGSARKRFIREARAAAAVKNEHVVGIYDVQEDAQPPYLVMECIDGIALQDKLDKHGALGVKEILRIGMQIAEGLANAHKQGLVHRDIKPANILLENGVERLKITDFGLARAVDDVSVTQSGTVAGTPMYMSPEQAEGLPIDHRSDLFSLGTVLYAMCTGHPPFRATGTHAILKRVIEDTPRPIRETNNEIPDWLCDIIAKLHAKKPEHRFQTAKEVAELLGQHLAHLQQPTLAGRPPRVDVPAHPVGDAAQNRRFVAGCAWIGAGLSLLWLGGTIAAASVWDLRTTLLAGIGLFGSLAFALLGLSVLARRFGRPKWNLRLGQAAIFSGVLALACGTATLVMMAMTFTFTYVVALEMDDPDTIVRIWPTAQTEPPVNLAGPVDILGNPAHVIQHTAATELRLPAGHYWLTAELDGQEVYRAFMHVKPDSFQIHYHEQKGNVHSWVGSSVFGLPKVVAIPAAANLVQKEKNKLRWGAWRVVAAETDGKPISKEVSELNATVRTAIDRGESWLVIVGDSLKHEDRLFGQTWLTGYTLNPRKKPATIDIRDGFPDGNTMLAIYRWEGDMLHICGSPRERPSDFTTAPGSERILIVLRNDAGKIEIKHMPPMPPPCPLGSFDERTAKERQDAWSKYLGVPVEYENSIGMKLRLIPPAEFMMGSTQEQIAKLNKEATEAKEDSWHDTIDREGPVHRVRLRQPYYVGLHEVTMAQFRQFMEAKSYKTEAERNGKGGIIPTGTGEMKRDPKATWRNPYNFAVKDDFPVLQVSWNDAQEFCDWLSKKEGRTYRLPTEAEWEFACRAGSDGLYSFGDDPFERVNHAVFNQTAPMSVGSKKPNRFGLFDMEGNAWEWCADWFGPYPAEPNRVGFWTNPQGPLKGTARAVRGGDYMHLSWVSRPAMRVGVLPNDGNNGTSFRVVIVGDLKAKTSVHQDDINRLQGLWAIESVELDGKKLPPDKLKGSIRFKDDKMEMNKPDGKTEIATITLDATANPKQFDVIGGGKHHLGIYRFDGERLVMCLGDEKERPTELTARPGTKWQVMVLKRVPAPSKKTGGSP